MKESISDNLQQIAARHEEIALLLSEPEVYSDQNRYRDLSREYAQIEAVVLSWREWQQTRASVSGEHRELDGVEADCERPRGFCAVSKEGGQVDLRLE